MKPSPQNTSTMLTSRKIRLTLHRAVINTNVTARFKASNSSRFTECSHSVQHRHAGARVRAGNVRRPILGLRRKQKARRRPSRTSAIVATEPAAKSVVVQQFTGG